MASVRNAFIIGVLFISLWVYFDSFGFFGPLKFLSNFLLLVGILLVSGNIDKERIMRVIFNDKK